MIEYLHPTGARAPRSSLPFCLIDASRRPLFGNHRHLRRSAPTGGRLASEQVAEIAGIRNDHLRQAVDHRQRGRQSLSSGRALLRRSRAHCVGSRVWLMVGLYSKELMIRGDVKRCLIVCLGMLVDQWQDEFDQKFQLSFDILTRDMLEASRSGNTNTSRVAVQADKGPLLNRPDLDPQGVHPASPRAAKGSCRALRDASRRAGAVRLRRARLARGVRHPGQDLPVRDAAGLLALHARRVRDGSRFESSTRR